MRSDFVAVTMMIGLRRFNTYLLVLFALALLGGCETGKGKKQFSTLRVHLEVNRNGREDNGPVPIYREKPVLVNVEKLPFLTEAGVTKARVVDVVGGFVIHVQFNQRGTWILENYSGSNPGKHFAIYSEFGEKGKSGRWLAAPVVPQRIADGTLVFTPDATREEADEIVLGLNNLAAAVAKKSK